MTEDERIVKVKYGIVVFAVICFLSASAIAVAQSRSESKINVGQSGFAKADRVDPEAVFCKEQHVYCQDVGVAPEQFAPVFKSKSPVAMPMQPPSPFGAGARPKPRASITDPFAVVVYGIECAAGDLGACAELTIALGGGADNSAPNVGQSGFPATGGTAPCSQSAAGCGTGGGGGGGFGGSSCGNPPNCGPMPNAKHKHQ